ncbi:Oidioi.mRNA.OKI2018_I69.XSR.g15322.t1.cds [Oikopleura dioica]|uniref:Oidioi.mRNA.OKI2018_I69.XSR.g15322.t1.cds n=1 Tax=Oikopleura dioica TaxID=34765 RepID=A0ABN7SGJ0_OIKDI|nr:Oidioi.mRNA.OKI2018_I69.XSR.g15322.t1.cds [Oikopleura dioica]
MVNNPLNGSTKHKSIPQEETFETAAESDHIAEGDGDVLYPALYPVVLFCLDQRSTPRYWCLRSIANPWFERISILVILINCISLGLYDPCQNKAGADCHSTKCRILEVLDDVVFAYFAVEMVIKMMAMGVWGKLGYLGDSWNRLDCFIVIAGALEYCLHLDNMNLTAIRTIRVLRPLRAINRVPSMRILVMLLLDTLPMLGNVLMLCTFVFFIFGVVAVQLWKGVLRQRCYLDLPENLAGNETQLKLDTYYGQYDEEAVICTTDGSQGLFRCAAGFLETYRDSSGEKCTGGAELWDGVSGLDQKYNVNGTNQCINWYRYYTGCNSGPENPFKGAISFDNIGYAWIAIFQVISLEGWVDIMYYVMDSHSFFSFIYFILLIVIGSFFMINLCLVVIATQFSETKQREQRLMEEARLKFMSNDSTLHSYQPPGSMYTELLRAVGSLLRRVKRKITRLQLMNSPHESKDSSIHEAPMSSCRSQRVTTTFVTSDMDCSCSDYDPEDKGAFEIDAEEVVDFRKSNQNRPCSKTTSAPKRERCNWLSNTFGTCWMVVKTEIDANCKIFKRIVDSKYFGHGIMIAILINTSSMGIEHHNQNEKLTEALEVSNVIFTTIFTLEMVMKILADGLFGYLQNFYNVFDASIVFVSIWEIVDDTDAGGLSVLRTFRLLRVLKLVRFLPALRRQLIVLMRTMDNVATFMMLLFLFIFIFSILGMHLFGCKFCWINKHSETECDRANFDSLLWAIVTVFQILTQEDWNLVLYNGMASSGPLASLYFIALMTIGNYVLFNLLVAILVEGFQAEGDEFEDEEDVSEQLVKRRETIASRIADTLPVITQTDATPVNSRNPSRAASLRQTATANHSIEVTEHFINPTGADGTYSNGDGNSNKADLLIVSNQNDPVSAQPSPIRNLLSPQPSLNPSRSSVSITTSHSDISRSRPLPSEDQTTLMMCTHCFCGRPPAWVYNRQRYSLFLFSPRNSFRKTCRKLTASKWFDYSILIFIFANCITIAMERPTLADDSPERALLNVSNHLFTLVFFIEMNIKVLALGFYCGSDAYLRSGWNVLDFLLVVCSIVDTFFVILSDSSPKILGILRVFRLLRTLRPLRVISRAPGLKLVVQTLISSLKQIGNIVLICCAFFVIFGILGVQLFKGKFYYCDSDDLRDIKTKEDCIKMGYRWLNQRYNFDNLGQALMSLFVLSSKDGWVQIMYNGIDAYEVDKQPVRNHNPWMLLYFISFLLIVAFFVLNMFVGVVVENFHRCRQEHEAEMQRKKMERRLKKERRRNRELRRAQRRQARIEAGLQKQHSEKKAPKKLGRFGRKKVTEDVKSKFATAVTTLKAFHSRQSEHTPQLNNYSPGRQKLHDIVTHRYFELIVASIIGLNILAMSLEHWSQPKIIDDILMYSNWFFTLVFVIEMSLKIFALGFGGYLADKWNQLDMVIVFLSVIGIVLEVLNEGHKLGVVTIPINISIIRVMRVLRIARVLKLLKTAKGVRRLLETVAHALPQVGNLGLLFLLLFFIFAALGVELFGTIVCDEDNPCEGLGRHASFANFGIAWLTLFRVSTGDNWNGIMKDALRDPSLGECNDDTVCTENCCVSGYIAPIYFVIFVMMAQFVLVNVVVAVLMKHLEESNSSAGDIEDPDAPAKRVGENDVRDVAQSSNAANSSKSEKRSSSPGGGASSIPQITVEEVDETSRFTEPTEETTLMSQSESSKVTSSRSQGHLYEICKPEAAHMMPDTPPKKLEVVIKNRKERLVSQRAFDEISHVIYEESSDSDGPTHPRHKMIDRRRDKLLGGIRIDSIEDHEGSSSPPYDDTRQSGSNTSLDTIYLAARRAMILDGYSEDRGSSVGNRADKSSATTATTLTVDTEMRFIDSPCSVHRSPNSESSNHAPQTQ